MPDGRIDPRQAERYRQMGAWLRKYGESIYATTGGPYKPDLWGVSTRRGSKVYLHVLHQWTKAGSEPPAPLRLPPLSRKVVACSALTGGTPAFRQTDEGLEIGLLEKDCDEIDTIFVLELDGPADDIKPISTLLRGSLTTGKKASASSIWSNDYNADKAFDGDEGTRWGGAPRSTSGWLEVDLGKPMTFDRVLILESPWHRVRKFQLQYRDGENWVTFHEGTKLGDFRLSFKPITAQRVRLNILDSTNVPTLWEFELFPPERKE
jgi:alpha-L-fucosidase